MRVVVLDDAELEDLANIVEWELRDEGAEEEDTVLRRGILAKLDRAAEDGARARALDVAVEALSYALENDADYLSEDTVAEWQQALEVLSAPSSDTEASS